MPPISDMMAIASGNSLRICYDDYPIIYLTRIRDVSKFDESSFRILLK